MRSSIKDVVSCNILQDDPLSPHSFTSKFDVITTSLCLEAACHTKQQYTDGLKKLAAYLVQDGVLLIAGMLNQNVYDVGSETFYSLHLNKDDIDEALGAAGFSAATWYIHHAADKQFDYEFDASGWFVLHTTRK